jgi:hypothetical protein
MRRLFLCTAFLATATQVAAQVKPAPATPPATTPPAATPPATTPPAATPAAAAPAQAAKAVEPSKSEFRVGGFIGSGERSYDRANNVNTATGQIRGVEVLLRGSGAGLYFRSLSGTFGKQGSTTNALQPKIISADARILLFAPTFTVFGGVGKRCVCGPPDKIYDVGMAGVSSTVNIGGSGLRTYISGAFLVAPDNSKPATSGSSSKVKLSNGLEGEAAVFYRHPSIPLFLTVGYRTEIFTGKTATATLPEEVRGLRVGAGIQFGGH